MSQLIPDRALRALRVAAEDLMTETVLVERQERGPGTVNRSTGEVVIGRTLIYSGKCFLGDRVEGAFTSGGFGSNPQEFAEDARTHNAVFRVPYDAAGASDIEVGDLATINGEEWRVRGRERSTAQATRFFRIVTFDPEKSFS